MQILNMSKRSQPFLFTNVYESTRTLYEENSENFGVHVADVAESRIQKLSMRRICRRVLSSEIYIFSFLVFPQNIL